jgi:geranylgeranyl pyrophosphate synthase
LNDNAERRADSRTLRPSTTRGRNAASGCARASSSPSRKAKAADAEDALGAAAALELLHNFSLIHDDIEDGDEMRHGRPTLWARHGVPAALEAGNAMSALVT